MGNIPLCNCFAIQTHNTKDASTAMTAKIILKDDPSLVYYNQNDLNESAQKGIEDLVVSGSYKSDKKYIFEAPMSVFMPAPKEEFSEISDIINNFIEGIRITKSEIEGLKINQSCKLFFKDVKYSEFYSEVVQIFYDKQKLFPYLVTTFNEILKFKKMIIESIERIKRNLKCTKYNNEITIFENYLAKKFYKNPIKDFESETEQIENIFRLISEESWNVDDSHETEDIFCVNEEILKIHFEFGNKSDFLKFIRMLADMKKSLLKIRKLNENFLDVVKQIYLPFKNLLEKLNRSSRIFNCSFNEESEDLDKLLKFYNGSGSKLINKISYSLK